MTHPVSPWTQPCLKLSLFLMQISQIPRGTPQFLSLQMPSSFTTHRGTTPQPGASPEGTRAHGEEGGPEVTGSYL
jgi:hypothetical protein